MGLLLGVSFFHFAAWISDVIDRKIKDIEREEEAAATPGGRNENYNAAYGVNSSSSSSQVSPDDLARGIMVERKRKGAMMNE